MKDSFGMELTDIVFSCKKCGHLMYLSMADKTVQDLARYLDGDCPRCGEESCENWQYWRLGNYNEEYGKNGRKETDR